MPLPLLPLTERAPAPSRVCCALELGRDILRGGHLQRNPKGPAQSWGGVSRAGQELQHRKRLHRTAVKQHQSGGAQSVQQHPDRHPCWLVHTDGRAPGGSDGFLLARLVRGPRSPSCPAPPRSRRPGENLFPSCVVESVAPARERLRRFLRREAAEVSLDAPRSRRKQAYEKEKQLQKERRQLRRNLKDILDSLLGAGSAWLADNNSLAPPTAESIFELPEVFFVFTDIEESTTMAAADPKAYG